MSIIDVANSTADAPVYVIRSLDDFAKIPPKRLKACLRDFRTAIETSVKVVAKLREMDESVAWPLSQFKWRDDGEYGDLRDMEFHLPNGESISLKELAEKRRCTLSERRSPDGGQTA